MVKRSRSTRFVSRGGDKLDGALDAFGIDVTGRAAADLGANVGGFTDCLLQRGARRVYSVETGYGVLAWKLRQDQRVVVLERTNALHVALPVHVDLVVADVGWTPLRVVVPRALELIGPEGQILALLKHQYEADPEEVTGGHVLEDAVTAIEDRVAADVQALEARILGSFVPSVERGGRNPERFLWIAPSGRGPTP